MPIGALILLPLSRTVSDSFFHREPFATERTWVGLQNYFDLLRQPAFLSSLRFGLIWAFIAVCLQTVIGLGLALLLNETFKGRSICRTLTFAPYLLAASITAMMFMWLFSSTYGLFDSYLEILGITVESWFDKSHAFLTLTLAAVWQFSPFSMIVILAGLQAIPVDLYEAAKIDGASAIRRFWHITIPGVRDAIFVAVLLRILWMFNKFDLPWLLTKGGPLGTTQNLPILTYRQAFEYLDFGMASTTAVIMIIVVVIIMYVYFKVYKP